MPQGYSPNNPFAPKDDFSDVESGSSSSVRKYSANNPFAKKKTGAKGILAPLAQGLTLGASDEILGAIEGVNDALFNEGGSFSRGYASGKEKVRNVGRDFHDEHPTASTLSELAGGLAAPVGALGMVGKGLSTGAKIARGAASGAVLGGFGGAASSSEGSRGIGAVGGGVLGGTVGMAIPAVGHVGREVLDELGARSQAGIEKRAIDKLLERFGHDQKDPHRLLNEMHVMERKGDGMVLDAGGRNVEGMAQAVLQVPGKEKERLAQSLTRRVRNQMPQLKGAIEKGAGESKDVRKLASEITARQAAESKPLYDAAKSLPIQNPDTQAEIKALMDLPDFKAAMKRGANISAIERNPMQGEVPLTVGDVDYMKRGLDAVIESRSSGEQAISRTEARALRQRLNELLKMVDEEHPVYGEARQTFAGHAESKEALEAGRNFLKESAEETAALKEGMSASEREHFTLGQQAAVNELMEKVGDSHDLTKKIIGNPAIRAKLRTVFPDDASYLGFLRSASTMAKQAGKKQAILGNSMTAERLQEAGNLLGLDFAKDVATGNVLGATRKGLGAGMKALSNAGSKKITESVGRKLQAKPGTEEFRTLMEEIAKRQAVKAPQQSRRLLPPLSLKNRTGAVGDQPLPSRTVEDQIKMYRDAGNHEAADNLARYADGSKVRRVAFHGTTHDFDTFKMHNAEIEGWAGKGHYFSSSPEDVAKNYAGVGPDLTNRIERYAEQLQYREPEKYRELVGADDVYQLQAHSPERKEAERRLREYARAQVAGSHEGATIPAFLRIKNPVEFEGVERKWNGNMQRQRPPRGGTQYWDEIERYDEKTDDYTITPFGKKVLRAIEKTAAKFDVDPDYIRQSVLGDGEMPSANEILDAFKNNEHLIDLTDEHGNIASSEVAMEFFRQLGHDGMILRNAEREFPNMGMREGTEHYTVWKPNQIKSVIGNSGKFDPKVKKITGHTGLKMLGAISGTGAAAAGLGALHGRRNK